MKHVSFKKKKHQQIGFDCYVPDADVFLLLYSFYRFTLHAAFRAIVRLILEAIPTREATAAAQFKIIALAAKVHRLSNHLLSFFYQSRL